MSSNESAIGQEFDVVVIGSGFGGAAVALRLAQAGRSVGILERGKEYPTGRGEIIYSLPIIETGELSLMLLSTEYPNLRPEGAYK
jgi:choline dehydrogenase-like flavoprotein